MVKEVLIAAKIARRELSGRWNLLGLWNLLPPAMEPVRRLEIVIDAQAQQVRGQPIGGAGDREGAVRQIEVEPFGLGRPMRGQADFAAEASRPARHGPGLRQV